MAARTRTNWTLLAATAFMVSVAAVAARSDVTHGARQQSTWRVDSTVDAADSQPGDGLCADAAGGCTLRAAIQEANAWSGSDTVALPAGRYVLTLADPAGVSPADPALGEQTGDLDIRDTLTIEGAGSEVTILDGDLRLAVLRAHPGVSVAVRGVAIERGGGYGIGGSCLYAQGPATIDRAAITGCDGVAVWAEQALTVTASRFEENQVGLVATSALHVGSSAFARHRQGAIHASGPTWIEDTKFVANHATAGAALDATGDLTVRRSTFEANDGTSGALFYGGRIRSSVEISDSAFIGNRATSGAAIHMFAGRMTITNSTFAGNLASSGSVISARGYVTLTHVTLHDGNLEVHGGGVVLHNTLLARSRCVVQGGAILSLGHNIESADTCGLDLALGDQPNASVPPMALGDNGGPTQSMMPDDSAGARHPALDAADPTACPATDQRGFLRPAGRACDIGAVERGAVPGAPTALPSPVHLPTRSTAPPTPTASAPGPLPGTLAPVARIGGAITDLVIFGDLAARAAGTGVTLLDVADPDAPRALGRLELDAIVHALAGPTDDGDLVALAGGDIVRIAVHDPRRPMVAGRIALPTLPVEGTSTYARERVVHRPFDLAVRGTTVVVAIVQENTRASVEHMTTTSAALATLDLAALGSGWTLVWQSGTYRSPFVSVYDVALSDTRLFAVFEPETMFAPRMPTIIVVDRASGATGVVALQAWDGVAAIAPDGNDLWLAAEPPPDSRSTPMPPRGLVRLDATDAALPRLGPTVTLAVTVPVRDVVLRGRTAWVLASASSTASADSRLLTVDIDDPNPTAAGPAATFSAYGSVLAGDGQRLLVGDDGGWVRVVTTVDRTGTVRGELPDVGPVVAAAVTGGRLLTGGPGGSASLAVVDVTRAEGPRWTASWGRMRSRRWSYGRVDLAVEGDTVWVADEAGLNEVDLARPEAPRLVGSWLLQAGGVVRVGGRTYVVGWGENGRERGLMTAEGGIAGTPRLRGAWFPSIDFQALASGVDGGLLAISHRTVVRWAMDAAGEPRVRSVLDLDLAPAHGGTWVPSPSCCTPQVAARPGLGAAANGDVTLFDPASAPVLRILGSIQLPSRSAEGVTLHGDLAIVAAGYDGIAVVDVRTPSRPVALAMIDTPGYARRVALDWPLIYVADSDAGVSVLRYTGPSGGSDPAVTATPPPTASPTPSRRYTVWLPFGIRP